MLLIINHYKDMHFLFTSIHNKTKNPPEYQNPHLKKNPASQKKTKQCDGRNERLNNSL